MDSAKSILSNADPDPATSNDATETVVNSTISSQPANSSSSASQPMTINGNDAGVDDDADESDASDSSSSDSNESDESDDDQVEDDEDPETLDPDNLTPIGDAECCICMDPIRLPLVLPCRHQFCYLCLKAAYDRNPSCPLCRRRIPATIVENAKVRESQIPFTKVADKVPVVWFYSARTVGWWAYDPAISEEIEQNYQRYRHDPTATTCIIWIMGRSYTIDFTTMEQRTNHARRYIKRETDVSALQGLAKGVAGMKLQA